MRAIFFRKDGSAWERECQGGYYHVIPDPDHPGLAERYEADPYPDADGNVLYRWKDTIEHGPQGGADQTRLVLEQIGRIPPPPPPPDSDRVLELMFSSSGVAKHDPPPGLMTGLPGVAELVSRRCSKNAAMWEGIIRRLLDLGYHVHDLVLEDDPDHELLRIKDRVSDRTLAYVSTFASCPDTFRIRP